MILLDISLTNGWLIIIGIIISVILYNLYDANTNLSKANSKIVQQGLEFKKREAEIKVEFQSWAINEFDRFKRAEIEAIKRDAERNSLSAASVLLQEWKIENEAKIRQDAINRSYSVNLGKITEHLVPFHASFLSQFNPKDARFIGSPIDLIVFDGCSDKSDQITIYFVEIKTGNSKLTELQKKIKTSIINGNIRWAEINPDQQKSSITQ